MFYGRRVGDGQGPQKKNDRYEQMTKQQELIELKKREIQAKAEAEKHKKEMEIMLKKAAAKSGSGSRSSVDIKSSSTSNKESHDHDRESGRKIREEKKPSVPNVFANDGSFLDQFRRMQEERKRKEKEEESKGPAPVKVKEELPEELNEYGTKAVVNKPSIKIINAPIKSSSGPIQDQEPSQSHSQSVPPPNFYHNQNVGSLPPPPPPPRDHPDRDRDRDRERERERERDRDREQDRDRDHDRNYGRDVGPSNTIQQIGGFPSQTVKQLAQDVASGGEHIEEMARVENQNDPLMWFLYKPNSAEYKRYRDLVAQYKSESQNQNLKEKSMPVAFKSEKRQNSSSSSSSDDEYGGKSSSSRHSKKRASRWGPQGDDDPVTSSGSPLRFDPNAHFGPPGTSPPSQAPGFGFSNATSPPGESTNGLQPLNPGLGTPTMIPPPGFPPPGHFPPGVNPNFSEFMHTPPPPPPPPIVGGQPPGVGPWNVKEEMPRNSFAAPVGIGNFPLMSSMDFNPKPVLSKVTRQSPQLLAYAQQAYGTTNLDEEQWKQCEEAYKMNLIFQDIARKKANDQKLEEEGKYKHEYDSDEDIDDGGTWEHKNRMKEMEKTKEWATDLTVKAKGKHHIGDFLPPEELAKFMEKYKAVKEGRQLDASDYQEFKIAESNVGFKMLQKMGWSDGEGLGSTGQGITAPIEKGHAVSDKQGLGQDKPGDLNEDDDEYTAYRKRMMLAYRFRPNPLNNPRRAYY